MVELLRLFFRIILRLLYRVEVHGADNYHKAGKRVLIIANHVSFLDGILLAAFLPRMPVFVINTYMAQNWWVKPFLRPIKYATIDPTNPLYVKSLIRTIEEDEPVAIFPEGRITVTGSLMKVYQGPGLVADKTGATILPVYIDGAKYSTFSRLKGVIRQQWFPKIRISILPPKKIDIDRQVKGRERRHLAGQMLEDIMRDMVFVSGDFEKTLFQAILNAAQTHGYNLPVVEDINLKEFTYRQLLRSAFGLSYALHQPLSAARCVGLMLPNAIPMVVSTLAMHLLGKVPAMINYTMGPAGIRSAINTSRIGIVVTSRKFIEVAGLQEIIDAISQEAKIIYLEDIKENIGVTIKFRALIASMFPESAWKMSQASRDADETAVTLFTSGSEGAPKGVALSHKNLLANRAQLEAVINFTSRDVMLNAMPLFHSFGFLAGMVLPLTTGIKLFLYPSPLHYSVIPELSYDIRATILFGTNTFLSGYARKAHNYDFHEIRLVLAGAEKLQDDTRKTWFEKFGLRILEGYGATETSPVISINTPMYYRTGTVGRLLPGIQYFLEKVPGIDTGGRLHVKGLNIMKGYFLPENPGVLQPPATSQGEGWYDTGDIVNVDEAGFLAIQGRAKRFAKIAGEMVSLTQVELLAKQCWPDETHAVVAIPDPKKGEQLAMLTTFDHPDRKFLIQVAKKLGQNELLVPKTIIKVDQIPVLGTGKTDYHQVLSIVEQA